MPGKPGMKGEGLGGRREGAGRPKEWFQARKGQQLIVERETIGGEICKPEFWTVLSVSEREIEFQIDNDIIVIHWPEEDE